MKTKIRFRSAARGAPAVCVAHLTLGKNMRFVFFIALCYSCGSSLAQDLAIDHLWIHVTKGAPEANALARAGLQIDRTTGVVQHRGQGTASVFVRFKNIYLELIWVEDELLLRKAAPELGYTLLQHPRSSPFGIALRDLRPDPVSLPFESSSFWAEWMRPGVSIAVAKRSKDAPNDPAIFVVPHYMRWDVRTDSQPNLRRAAVHELDVGAVTRVVVHGPRIPSGSQAAQVLTKAALVEFTPHETHLLELEFDRRRAKSADLRPTLPLLIHH